MTPSNRRSNSSTPTRPTVQLLRPASLSRLRQRRGGANCKSAATLSRWRYARATSSDRLSPRTPPSTERDPRSLQESHSKYEFDYLDFQRRGYFGAPSVPQDAAPPRNWSRTPWYGWAFAFDRARHGDFSALPHLLSLLEEDLGGTFEQAVSVLLGDAGFGDMFNGLKALMSRHEGYDLSFYAAAAIASRGKLGDVPLLIEFHKATHHLPDVPSVPEMLSDLLHPEGLLPLPNEFGSVDEYCDMVERTWKDLAERFGTTEVYLWLGEPTSVRRMARTILARAREPYFPSSFRRKFEASTGINCSAFYRPDRLFQPLSAAALVEDFLNSPRVEQFLDGARFFFGTRLPD